MADSDTNINFDRSDTEIEKTIQITQDDLKTDTAEKLKPKDKTGSSNNSSRMNFTSIFGINQTSVFARAFEKRKDIDELVEPKNDSEKNKTIQKDVHENANLNAVSSTYQVITDFAEGGQGIISSAVDLPLNRVVALKSLRKELLNNTSARANFIAEAKITAQLDHPGIISIYNLAGDEENGLHLAMQMINGQTLKEYLEKIQLHYKMDGSNKFDEEKSIFFRLELFLHVCDAISYAHHSNVMHCDLKPENIMIGEYREAYVMDWGIARLIEDPEVLTEKWEKPEKLSGTPRFLSPEAVLGLYCDARADIYALGLVLFEMVFLQNAFDGETTKDVLLRIKNNDIAPYSHAFGCKVADDLVAIIRKATSYDREQRYQTVEDFSNDLRKYMRHEEVSANPDHLFGKIIRWGYHHIKAVILLSLTFMLAATISVAYTWYQQMNQAVVNRQRDVATSFAYTHSLDAATLIMRQMSQLENALLSFTREAGFLMDTDLLENKTTGMEFFDSDELRKMSELPPSFIYSEPYRQKIALDNFTYKLIPELAKESVQPLLNRLYLLHQKMFQLLLESDLGVLISYDNMQMLKEKFIQTGAPALWIYMGFENGLHICYPGNYDYPDDYDVRERTWYLNALENSGSPVWSAPYADVGLEDLVMTVSMMMADKEGKPYGACAIDISLSYIIKIMNEYGNQGKYVQAKYLLDYSGNILVSNTSNRGQLKQAIADGNGDIQLAVFPDGKLFKEMKQQKSGVVSTVKRNQEVIYAFTTLPNLQLIYVEKLSLSPLIERSKNIIVNQELEAEIKKEKAAKNQ